MKTYKLGMLASVMALSAGMATAGEIAVIVKTTSSNFWQNVNKGAEAAIAAQSEHSFSFDGPATESAVADQVNLVENAINRGVSGIVLAPSDPEALAPVVKRAYESGIPVVIIDSALTDGAKGTYQAFLSTDNCAAGEEVAKRMIDEAGTEGKVAVMSYVAGVGSEIGRVGCFSDYLTANSDLEIVGPYYSQSQMAQALNQTTDILASNPDLVGIFGANEPTAVGMGRAIMQAGKAGQLVALGFDGNEDLQQFVREGLMEATAVQGSFAMGEKGVNAIIDILGGEKVEPFINTGVVLVDQENIDSDQAKNVLY
ncbi:MAG: ABC transporter substrate-binding protein [Marinovum algicola]|jgi:ribose transport system substrate-binding protein|uniref:Ribose transport system substrate-binding protein n=1 Tax=Marinovum algicola TaxID=42444 RepID=A0A975ZNQ6_9RHOB|nr:MULTISPECIES: ABC transporter substrate-binding protein [Marinovum]AKO95450.1 ABC-type sugar transport system, periplasmic component [Marinovum algicola DG 898]MDD9741608.1 ABC transporter substrate-binding protein [Marinovum sp. SP66]MDD9743697.1 ABC transporter substrate-binding protein [Marinovum sp. PR37]SEJ62651.1 ribose transport system substrate-binding protein [Marinovum algicola]SLN52474.1 D-allose-binding periplasmic protein precursor [Marinovum algicola]